MARSAHTDTTPDDDETLRRLCAAVFSRPHAVVQVLTHSVTHRFSIAPHRHADLLQLDLIDGCAGHAIVQQRDQRLTGLSALAAAPGHAHGYELLPGKSPSRVYHLKLRVRRQHAPALHALLAPVACDLPAAEPLRAAMRAVARLGLVHDRRPPMLLTRLCEALCLWPRRDHARDTGPVDTAHTDGFDRGIEQALRLIDQRPHHPPSIRELADAAHFSTRHFTRRFRALFGCTPHQYLTARRFAAARQLLSEDRLPIGTISDTLGFGSVATFSRWFTRHAGASPSAYRNDPTRM